VVDDPDLERRFHRAMVDIYERAKREVGYTATRFIQMVGEKGGLETARYLLSTGPVSDGFVTLWEKGRLDLTVEAHVTSAEFRPLFTAAEIGIAEDRLQSYGMRT
jgi:hypothetical protein